MNDESKSPQTEVTLRMESKEVRALMSVFSFYERCPKNNKYMKITNAPILLQGEWTDSGSQMTLKHRTKTIHAYMDVFRGVPLVNDHDNDRVIGYISDVYVTQTGIAATIIVQNEYAQKEIEDGKRGLSIKATCEIDMDTGEVLSYYGDVNVSLVADPACQKCLIGDKKIKTYSTEKVSMNNDTELILEETKVNMGEEIRPTDSLALAVAELTQEIKILNSKKDVEVVQAEDTSATIENGEDTMEIEKDELKTLIADVVAQTTAEAYKGIMDDVDSRFEKLAIAETEEIKTEDKVEDTEVKTETEEIPEKEIIMNIDPKYDEMLAFYEAEKARKAEQEETHRSTVLAELAKYNVDVDELAEESTKSLELILSAKKEVDEKVLSMRRGELDDFKNVNVEEVEAKLEGMDELDMANELLSYAIMTRKQNIEYVMAK